MSSFFKRFRRRDEPSAVQQLKVLRHSLDLAPQELPIEDLFPLLAPASFFESGRWHGPFELLAVPGLALTWAVEQPSQTMLYVSNAAADYWSSSGIDWRLESLRNLERRSDPTFCTGHFPRTEDPNTHFALIFMHPDGYGPSRLLLWEELDVIYPQGYLVGVPEMSCGLAIAADATAEERAKIEGVVRDCYTCGTRPLVPGLHHPSLLRPRAT